MKPTLLSPPDKQITAPGPLHDTAAGLGQCSLDHLFTVGSFPPADSKTEFKDFFVQGGGPVATALVVLSRWGIRTRFAGVVGGDRCGRSILDGLERETIDTSACVLRDGCRSQIAFVCVERDTGKRTIFWGRPEGPEMQPKEIPADFLNGIRVLLLDGSFRDASLHLARMARACRIPVVLDAGSMKPGVLDLVRSTDHLIASLTFARQLSPDRPLEHLLYDLKRMGPDLVTITLGEGGSVSLWAEAPVHVPALPVLALDTTGAGDVFHGAYLYGLLRGWPPHERIRWATVAAGLKCRSLGGRTGIPDHKTVAAYLPFLQPSRPTFDANGF